MILKWVREYTTLSALKEGQSKYALNKEVAREMWCVLQG